MRRIAATGLRQAARLALVSALNARAGSAETAGYRNRLIEGLAAECSFVCRFKAILEASHDGTELYSREVRLGYLASVCAALNRH